MAVLFAAAVAFASARAQPPANPIAAGGHGAGPASPLDRTVSVYVTDATVHDAVEQLRSSTGFDFNYENAVVDSTPTRVTFHDSRTTLARALAYILRGTGLIATPFESSVIIKRAVPATVRGRVVNSQTGRPIAGATVIVEGLWHRALTSDSGSYRLDSVPPGNFLIGARLVGYHPASSSVSVAPASRSTADLQLEQFSGALDRVVVTSTVVPTAVKELPTPISVVTRNEIQQQHYTRIDDIFRGAVPGSIAWEQGNYDYFSTITVRGINSLDVNGIKTYIDGVEVADYNFAAVDPNSIDRIELIRGPEASTIYGSDASGGVMQIFTQHGRGAPNHPTLSASVTEGIVQDPARSAGALQQNYAASLSGALSTASNDHASYDVGASYRRVGAWTPGYYSSDPSGYGGLHLEHGRLSIDLSGRYLQRDFPVVISPALVATNIPALALPPHVTEQLHEETYGLTLTYRAAAWWRQTLTVGHDQSQLSYASTTPQFADSGLVSLDQATAKSSISYNTSAIASIGSELHGTATLGFDHYDRTFDLATGSHLPSVVGAVSDTAGEIQREPVSNTGLFAQLQVGIRDELFLTAGGRVDNNSGVGPAYGYAWAPRFGFSYVHAFGDVTLKARGAYGQGIQPGVPSEREAQRIPFLTQLPNRALAPERQIGGDVGVDVAFGGVGFVSATYYNQRARNLIQQVVLKSDTTGVTLQYQNVGQVNNRGFEIQGSITTTTLRIDGQFSYTSSKVARLPPPSEYTGDYRVGDQALLVPLTSGGFTVSSRAWRGATIAGGGVYIGYWTSYNYASLDSAIYANKPLASTRLYWQRFPGFVKFRASVDQDIREGLTAFIAMDNLTDSHATEQNALYAVSGRTTSVGLRIRY